MHRLRVYAGCIVLVLLVIVVTDLKAVRFDREKWHDPSTDIDEFYAMVADLRRNVIRPYATTGDEVIQVLGPPTLSYQDAFYYGLWERPSAFDATYLIIFLNQSGVVTGTRIVDH